MYTNRNNPISSRNTSPNLYWTCMLLLLFFTACDNEEVEPPVNRYEFKVPDNFPEPTYTFDNNPISKAGVELGKALFYDVALSRDGSVSCNNCHVQSTAFADSPIHPLSVGVDNRLGLRNAPSLVNMAFFPEFFWDGGVTHLDFVPINAIEAEFELDETVENIVEKLNAKPHYRTMFQDAFGIEEITLPYVLHALSQFTNMMVSANSKYDKHVRGEGETLSSLEMQGYRIFQKKCASCHSGDLFTDFSYRNNGLDSTFADRGRNMITELDSDIGKFRVPSLRNVGLTAPYMHHARFSTLEEVLEHYDNGMINSPTLDDSFIRPDGLGIPLEETEKEAIISFLHTLTDRTFVQDTLFFRN